MYVLGDKFFAIALAVKIAQKPIRDFKKDTPEVTHSLQAQSKGAAAAPMTVFEAKLAATMESFSAAFAERAARMAVAVPSWSDQADLPSSNQLTKTGESIRRLDSRVYNSRNAPVNN